MSDAGRPIGSDDHTVLAGIPGIDISAINDAVDADKLATYGDAMMTTLGAALREPPVPAQGIDVGFPQGEIDWPTLAQSRSSTHPDFVLSFAYIRASAGDNGGDPQLARNAGGAMDVLPAAHGFYHAASPDGDAGDARREAANFLNRVGPYRNGTLRPMLDVEVRRKSLPSGEPFVCWVLDWCDYVAEARGIEPLIYTYGPFWQDAAGGAGASMELLARLRAYPLWLAAYVPRGALDKYVPQPWKDAGPSLWQASGDQAAPPDVPLRLAGIGVSPGSNPICDRDVLLHPGGLDWLRGRSRSVAANEAIVPGGSTAVTGLGEADRAENLVSDGGGGERHGVYDHG